MKALGSTRERHLRLRRSSLREGGGIPGVAVKCVEIRRNTSGEGGPLLKTDAEVRKRGEQTGLDTLVVHAVNDVD